jgi:ATP-dependent exoDNAse (exonuclease V) alpha subunit
VGVQGRAGTGKTTMLTEVKRIAEANSFRVLGLGPSGRAVQELTQAGIESQTIARFTLAQDKGVDDKTVLVIDEAGMVPTLSMRDVLKSAERSNAKVVVIGDERQLKAVEAGRPFGQLHEHGTEFALMEEIQRQKEPQLREAVREASQGKILESIARMQPQTLEIADDETRYRHIAQEFAVLEPNQRKDTLVITGTVNSRVLEASHLRPDEATGGVMISGLGRGWF